MRSTSYHVVNTGYLVVRNPMESKNTHPVHSTHVYDVLADLFLQQGVSTCFALLGDANMHAV